MKFIWSHHLIDVVFPIIGIIGRFAGPEFTNIQEQFCSILLHKLQVAGGMKIVPGIVCNGQGYVPLKRAVIVAPLTRQWIQMNHLGLLPAIASTLPWEHGPFISVLFGISTGRIQPAVSVHQDRFNHLGKMHVIEGQNI